MIDKENISIVSNEMDFDGCNIPEEECAWSCTYPECMVDDNDSGWNGCIGPCS